MRAKGCTGTDAALYRVHSSGTSESRFGVEARCSVALRAYARCILTTFAGKAPWVWDLRSTTNPATSHDAWSHWPGLQWAGLYKVARLHGSWVRVRAWDPEGVWGQHLAPGQDTIQSQHQLTNKAGKRHLSIIAISIRIRRQYLETAAGSIGVCFRLCVQGTDGPIAELTLQRSQLEPSSA